MNVLSAVEVILFLCLATAVFQVESLSNSRIAYRVCTIHKRAVGVSATQLSVRNAVSVDECIRNEVMALRASEIKKVLTNLNADTKGLYDRDDLGKLLISLELESINRRWSWYGISWKHCTALQKMIILRFQRGSGHNSSHVWSKSWRYEDKVRRHWCRNKEEESEIYDRYWCQYKSHTEDVHNFVRYSLLCPHYPLRLFLSYSVSSLASFVDRLIVHWLTDKLCSWIIHGSMQIMSSNSDTFLTNILYITSRPRQWSRTDQHCGTWRWRDSCC